MILVGSTTAVWKCRNGEELAWLKHAEAMRDSSPVPLEFFCAAQMENLTGNIPEPMRPLFERLADLQTYGAVWRFGLDGWAPTTTGRLIGITTGRNLIREHALRDTDATHVLFLDTDVEPDADCIPKLLELEHPVVGGHVGEYVLSGPRVLCWEGHVDRLECSRVKSTTGHDCGSWKGTPMPHVEEHWNTAGFLLVQREVLVDVAWRWEGPGRRTDDPCFALDVERAGYGRTWVHKGVRGKHPSLVPVESR